MVSNDAPIIMAKACELLIADLAFRSEFFCKKAKRKVLNVSLLERRYMYYNIKYGDVRFFDRYGTKR